MLEALKMTQRLILVLLGIFVHSAASAEVYLGGGIGRTDFDLPNFDDATGFNLRGGWQYSPYVAFEGSYWDSGDADSDYWSFDVSGDAFLLGGRFSTDVRLPFQAYARVGLGLWDVSGGDESDDGADLYYAIGAAYTSSSARYFVEYQNLEIDSDGVSIDVSTVGAGFEYRCCSRRVASTLYMSKPEIPEASLPNQTSYAGASAQTTQVSANSAVIIESLDPVESDIEASAVEVVTYSPEEEVVVTAPAPVHPMKIAIQEGCNVVSVKVIDESEVWDLFCPSTLKRITVTI